MPFGARSELEPAVIVGFGTTSIGKHSGRTPIGLAIEAFESALAVSRLSPADVEGLFSVPEGYTWAQPPIRMQRIAERLGIRTRALAEVENGGCSAMFAFKAACQDIATGHLDVAVVLGAQAERSLLADGIDAGDLDRLLQLNAMYGPFLGPYGVLAALPCYALAAQRYMHEHRLAPEDVAELPVRLRENARRTTARSCGSRSRLRTSSPRAWSRLRFTNWRRLPGRTARRRSSLPPTVSPGNADSTGPC